MKLPTFIELALLAAFAAAAAFLVAPDFAKARDGYRVALAAKATASCDKERRYLLATMEGLRPEDLSLAMIDESLASRRKSPLTWPEGADLASLDLVSTGGVSVVVRLFAGPRRVSARDADPDRAN